MSIVDEKNYINRMYEYFMPDASPNIPLPNPHDPNGPDKKDLLYRPCQKSRPAECDLSRFRKHDVPPVAVPAPAVLTLILEAKNAGSLWAEQALGEISTLTGVPYFFERQTGFNSVFYTISQKV